jgi:hypothetical protein
MSRTHLVWGAIAALATTVVPAPVASAVTPIDCSMTVAGDNSLSLGHVSAHVRPAGERPLATGTFVVRLPDGDGHLVAHVDSLFCRRDGGLVPEHGGANIADLEGSARLWCTGSPPTDVHLSAHVEDRGRGFEDQDYVAWYLSTGSEEDRVDLALGANFLARGDVRLTPVRS